MLCHIIHADLELSFGSITHVDRVKVVVSTCLILEILLHQGWINTISSIVEGLPHWGCLRLVLFSWKEHLRLGKDCKYHLMAVLDVVDHSVDQGNVFRVGESGAFLLGWVEVGVCGADNVLAVPSFKYHVWLNVGKLDATRDNFGIIDHIGVAIHELEVASKGLRGLNLVKSLAVDLSVCSGRRPQSNIFKMTVELEIKILIIA